MTELYLDLNRKKTDENSIIIMGIDANKKDESFPSSKIGFVPHIDDTDKKKAETIQNISKSFEFDIPDKEDNLYLDDKVSNLDKSETIGNIEHLEEVKSNEGNIKTNDEEQEKPDAIEENQSTSSFIEKVSSFFVKKDKK